MTRKRGQASISRTINRTSTTYADYGMTYDMASRITQLSFTSLVGAYGTSAYSYDFTNQLTAADHTGTGMPADVFDRRLTHLLPPTPGASARHVLNRVLRG